MLRPSDRAPGLMVGEGVELPESADVGANVVLHAGTVIGEDACLQDGAVVGKPLALGPRSRAARGATPPAIVGVGTTICVGAVLVAGARIEDGAVVGDQAHVRERAVVGAGTVVGRGSAIDNDVTIGAGVRVQTGCYVTAYSTVEEDVFIAPSVTLTNDDTMGRHGPDYEVRGAALRRACRVGARAVLLPGIEVGEEAYVAAGSVVTRSVPARTLVMGTPARPVREIDDAELLERWS